MKRRKLLILILIFVLSFSVFTGCSKDEKEDIGVISNEDTAKVDDVVTEYGVNINEDSVIFKDSMEEEITIKKNPKRVIVLQNSLLDIWDQAGGSVIGRVDESEDKIVENAKSAESVGTLGAPSLEKILSLEPDLVILASSYTVQREMIPSLQQSNIQVIALDNDLLEDYYKTVRIFTAITEREDLYVNHVEKIQKGVEAIIEKAPTDKNLKVLLMFASAKSLTVRASDSMVGEMLKDLNTINISDIAIGTDNATTFSMEKIIEEDPDFIFVQTMGSDLEKIQERLKSDAESSPAWASIKAVKEGRYIVLPKDLYMYKPNERYPEAYEGLAKMLYPEVFQ